MVPLAAIIRDITGRYYNGCKALIKINIIILYMINHIYYLIKLNLKNKGFISFPLKNPKLYILLLWK